MLSERLGVADASEEQHGIGGLRLVCRGALVEGQQGLVFEIGEIHLLLLGGSQRCDDALPVGFAELLWCLAHHKDVGALGGSTDVAQMASWDEVVVAKETIVFCD